jgi:CMP/dCMP kinase
MNYHCRCCFVGGKYVESSVSLPAGRGETRDHAEALANLRERDRIDSSRVVAPLRSAPDAVVLDTTDLSLDQVLDRIHSPVG